MRVGLFIPCYIDQFYPQVGIATLQLLQRLGCDVDFPLEQTCCGQPMANSGFANLTSGCDKNFVRNFCGFDYIVAPSGSCVLHLREHLGGGPASAHIRQHVYELSEFLVDVLQVTSLPGIFPYTVGLHVSCHGQRGLHTSSMSERVAPVFSKAEYLLGLVKGIDIKKPARPDECCGFGGTFCVFEEAVSVKMGKDRLREHIANNVSFITGADTSCLMHYEGILNRLRIPIRVIHLAEILNHSGDASILPEAALRNTQSSRHE